jgi:hypothetical protein
MVQSDTFALINAMLCAIIFFAAGDAPYAPQQFVPYR